MCNVNYEQLLYLIREQPRRHCKYIHRAPDSEPTSYSITHLKFAQRNIPPPPYKHFSKVELDKPRPEDISPSLISLLRALVLPLKQKVPPQSHFRLTTYSLPITRVKWGRDR